MNLVKVINSVVSGLGTRVVKFYRFGLKDVQTSEAVAPYGVDSNPVKDMIAVYAETTIKGETKIIGYINKNSLAEVGELRLFSTDADGGEKNYVWLKSGAFMELNGSEDNVVRFKKLDDALQNEVKLINLQLKAISTAIGNIGGTYTPVDVTVDVSGSKVDNVKCS